VASLGSVLTTSEKGKLMKNQTETPLLPPPPFFKSRIPSVTIPVVAEIYPALCPPEIQGYIWVFTSGNGKSTVVPSSEVQSPWQSQLAKH